MLLRNVERLYASIFLPEKLRNLCNKERSRRPQIIPNSMTISTPVTWISSSLFLDRVFKSHQQNHAWEHFPDSVTLGETETTPLTILLSWARFYSYPWLFWKVSFSEGALLLHALLTGCFLHTKLNVIVYWAKVGTENGNEWERMCIWIHIMLFMPMGPRHGARIKISLFIYLCELQGSFKK